MRRMPWVAQHLAAIRTLLVLTLVLGVAYPLLITLVAQLPGLKSRADGSLLRSSSSGTVVGSALIGQGFTDTKGNPLRQYFQSRPSAAGAAGYDPTASGASNLGPESGACSPRSAPAAWPWPGSTASTGAAPTAPPTASAPCSGCSAATG